ncbi:MAG: hypothetical protein ACNA70_07505 [Brevefilum sp.]
MNNDFVKTLMEHIMEATMIPKSQIERAVGPILSMFLPAVLTETFRTDPALAGRFEMVCPEFPLKKTHNRQSTNIDWLMYHPGRKMLLLVELKTADTSVNEAQNTIYREVQDRVSQQGGEFLVTDLEVLRDASKESGKYQYLLEQRIAPFRSQISTCREARLIYLVPKSAQRKVIGHADAVLTFGMLSDTISGPYAEEWKVIHAALCGLDVLSQRSRNQEFIAEPGLQGGKNYLGKLPLDAILDLCKEHGNAIVVGFSGGRTALENRPLDTLVGRQYKWDKVKGGSGTKSSSNWVPGETFAWVVTRKIARSEGTGQTPARKPTKRSVNWSGTAKFPGMVALCQQHGDDILIGFTGGRTAFVNTPLVDLQNRPHYKWDYASSTAKRTHTDWLAGGTVLELLRQYHGYAG